MFAFACLPRLRFAVAITPMMLLRCRAKLPVTPSFSPPADYFRHDATDIFFA